jgi:hypothetical protein
MNALSHTHKHALARQCLPRERRGCDTTITQGAWLLAPPLLSMDMKRGNASSQITGANACSTTFDVKTHHATLANVGT